MPKPLTANELRRTFTGFFADRGHTIVPSASVIPHDPTVLFTVAGMVPFKPYFTGDEVPSYKRATSVQKCIRAGGKHNDLDDVGRTARHLVFFEMLGNFSFGDYFKELAIPYAWEFYTEVLGLEADRLWVTVHVSDDEAADIWHDAVGVPVDRIQRLDDDNFWQMGDTGPCGPSSEIFYDMGDRFGAPGGPAFGGDERYPEMWNLVFMQYNQLADGSMVPLPKPSIDTGAGLERNLVVLQGVDSVWEIDVMVPLLDEAQRATGTRLGIADNSDVSLRIMAEHARSSAVLVNDGVFPSNEDRGYVLRRIIRRAVRHAFLLGSEQLVMPAMIERAIEVMGDAYPDLERNRDFITGVVVREEERFRQTMKNGLTIFDEEVDQLSEPKVLSGDVAFRLHDTFGFPLELTREIASERGIDIDNAGFDAAMAEQRRRGKDARKAAGQDGERDAYRELLEQFGQTEFTGYLEGETKARVARGAADRRRHDCRDLPRPHALLRGERRPGRRHRHDPHRHRRGRGARHDLRAPRASPSHCSRRRRRGQPRTGSGGGHRRRAPRRDPSQPHRHAPAALGVARGARAARQAGGLARRARPAPVRLQPLLAGLARGDRADRGSREPRGPREPAGACVRDHEVRGGSARRDRVLRRQVRRRRPGARGRPELARAVRRHPREGARRHRPDQGGVRRVDRVELATHRGDHGHRDDRPPAS